MTPRRHQQLHAFLRRLGLNPETSKGTSPSGLAGPSGLDAIEEALTHTSAALPRNHERLEFLGDAVLRLAAAEFLQGLQPPLGVGACSALRAQLVSDRWLSELATTCQLDPLIHLGPKALADQAGRATVRAEICEALVGGIYEAWGGASGGLAAVHTWLDPHWHRASAELLADPHRHNWKSALQEWSQGQGLGLPAYHCEERSRIHGDPRRFHCAVSIPMPAATPPGPPHQKLIDSTGQPLGAGWGGSRREAEQQAARQALATLQDGRDQE
jgi:ribonuclease-3